MYHFCKIYQGNYIWNDNKIDKTQRNLITRNPIYDSEPKHISKTTWVITLIGLLSLLCSALSRHKNLPIFLTEKSF